MDRPPEFDHEQTLTVPLFPLPNVVLFPRAILPLHIFEDRYKVMMADALSADRRIAMALLKPGWETNYYQAPFIHPVICIGRILSHERLPDGKYNLLLQGECRATVLAEKKAAPYRQAEVQLTESDSILEIDLSNQRQRLTDLICGPDLGNLPLMHDLKKIVQSPLPTCQVADLIAFLLLDDIDLKQSLLEETDVRKRVARLIRAVESAILASETSLPPYGNANMN